MYIHTACINQDSANPAAQLNGSLGNIIGSCDLMVTPVHDPHWQRWSAAGDEINDALTDYKAPGFLEYLGRGWCRLEMFFNANIPTKAGREKLFSSKLRHIMAEEKRRPHLLFGTRERDLCTFPIVIRALLDDEFEKFHPARGFFSDPRDAFVIEAYVKELLQINKGLRRKQLTILVPSTDTGQRELPSPIKRKSAKPRSTEQRGQ
jgi:hypothetical protein